MSYILINWQVKNLFIEWVNSLGYRLITLSRNECPFSPSPLVKKTVLDYLPYVNRYEVPGLLEKLVSAIANYVGVKPSYVQPLPGSEAFFVYTGEFMSLRNYTFVYSSPTFVPAVEDLKLRKVRIVDIPLKSDYTLDFNALTKVSGDKKVLYVVNPNNPTGNAVADCSSVAELLEKFEIVILDESYYEFSKITCSYLINKYENLAVLRTLSKAFCLAGARLGYLISRPKLRKEILSTRRSYDIPVLSLAAGLGALRDVEYMRDVVKKILKIKQEAIRDLIIIRGIEVVDTLTNFFLLKLRGLNSKELTDQLRKRGIDVKPLDGRLESYVRVSIGTENEMRSLIKAVQEISDSLL